MERAKYGFPVATVVFVVTAFLLAPPSPAAAADPHQVALDLRQNTVRIEAYFAEDQPELGFGFIVGEKAGTLYAVTAYHVVSDPHDAPGRPPGKVKVELFGGEDMIDAKLLGTHDSAHDLAVITFPAPDGFEWNKKCLGLQEHQNFMTEVSFVGRLQKWYVPTSNVKISSDEPRDSRINIDDLAVKPGSSGGPLIASSGIVGMILQDSAEGAQALSIASIKGSFKEWHFPFQLQSSAPPVEAVVEKSAPPPKAEASTPMSEGEAIAARNPLSAALRAQQPEGAGRRGFDLGMVSAKDQTLWGPGKQAMLDSLEGAEQEGFRAATYFSVDHNANVLLAETGAAIAEVDPVVAKVRMREQDAAFWLGFDIATGIFGDPKRGARGNTATGPGSLGIRDSLKSSASRRGFNASVALHLSRRY
ncbi:MAG: serine protease [Acidobacteriota bacterium]